MPNKYIRRGILVITFLVIALAVVNFASASFLKPGLKNNLDLDTGIVGETAGYESNVDLTSIVGIVIQTFLGILGVVFLVYMIYAGYNWMIAQGDEDRVTRAKDTIQRAIIGLIVTIAAYAISFWVFDKLLTTTNIIK